MLRDHAYKEIDLISEKALAADDLNSHKSRISQSNATKDTTASPKVCSYVTRTYLCDI